MKYLCIIALLVISTPALAILDYNITVGMVGVQEDGVSVYVQIIPNTHSCLWNGVYFTDAAERNKALSVALMARLTGKKVRVDYVQAGGPGTQCLGSGIFIQ